jgi:Zn-dependent protease with chaperone function
MLFLHGILTLTALFSLKRMLFISSFLCVVVSTYGQHHVTGFLSSPENADRSEAVALLESEYAVQSEMIEGYSLTRRQKTVLRDAYKARLKAGKMLLESNDAIFSGPLYDYVNAIFKNILSANPSLDQESRMVLFRNESFNAFTLGDNVVFVHTGLLYRLRNKEQLALVLAHELAHNMHRHAQQKMLESVRMRTDEELNREIRKISDQEYGQATALNELLLPVIYAQREQSRAHELEADSLGLVCFRNAGLESVRAFFLFDVMEHAEHVLEPELIDLPSAFALPASHPAVPRLARYTRVSSLGTFEEEPKDASESYLRTHPYETERTAALLRQLGVDGFDTLIAIDEEYLDYRYLAEGEMVYGAIGNGNFSDGIYYSLRMLEHYPGDAYARSALAYQLCMLSFYKTNRMSGKHVDKQNPRNDEVLDRLNFFLQGLTPEEAMELGTKFRTALPGDYENHLTAITDALLDYTAKKFDTYEVRREVLYPGIRKTLLEKPFNDIDEDFYIKQHKQPIKNKYKE